MVVPQIVSLGNFTAMFIRTVYVFNYLGGAQELLQSACNNLVLHSVTTDIQGLLGVCALGG